MVDRKVEHDSKSFSVTDIYMDYVKEYHKIQSFEQFRRFADEKKISVVYKEAKQIFSNRSNLDESLQRFVQTKKARRKNHKSCATDAVSTAQVDKHELETIHSDKALHTQRLLSAIMQDEKEREKERENDNNNKEKNNESKQNRNNLIFQDCNNNLYVKPSKQNTNVCCCIYISSLASDTLYVNNVNANYTPSVATGITGASSIAAPLSFVDPLIVIMGIGEYASEIDNLENDNLESVIKDCDNIIDTFLEYCEKYKPFYKLNNNKYIYTNNIDDIDNNYAIKWNRDDIDHFTQESRKHVVKNKHDGGYRGKVLCDSEYKNYKLDNIFSMYSAEVSSLLTSYEETEEESNHLLSISKIFCLDMCRCRGEAKVTQIGTQEKNQTKTTATTTMDDDNGKQETKTVVTNEMKEEESKPRNETENGKKKNQTRQVGSGAISLHNKNKEKKNITTNFSKIYALLNQFIDALKNSSRDCLDDRYIVRNENVRNYLWVKECILSSGVWCLKVNERMLDSGSQDDKTSNDKLAQSPTMKILSLVVSRSVEAGGDILLLDFVDEMTENALDIQKDIWQSVLNEQKAADNSYWHQILDYKSMANGEVRENKVAHSAAAELNEADLWYVKTMLNESNDFEKFGASNQQIYLTKLSILNHIMNVYLHLHL